MDELLNQLDESDKNDFERECFGPALICATIANVGRWFLVPKERPKVFNWQDFMPNADKKTKKKQTPEEMLALVKMMNAAHGGEFKG